MDLSCGYYRIIEGLWIADENVDAAINQSRGLGNHLHAEFKRRHPSPQPSSPTCWWTDL
jgi:hypothetical protein